MTDEIRHMSIHIAFLMPLPYIIYNRYLRIKYPIQRIPSFINPCILILDIIRTI